MDDSAVEPNQLSRLLVERINSGDVDGLVALYEDDTVLDIGDGWLAIGSEAIRRFWAQLVARGIQVTPGVQAGALVSGDIALASTHLPDGTVTAEIARRQRGEACCGVVASSV